MIYGFSVPVIFSKETQSKIIFSPQIGIDNAKVGALTDILSQILQDPAYQQLRNVEQLGKYLHHLQKDMDAIDYNIHVV